MLHGQGRAERFRVPEGHKRLSKPVTERAVSCRDREYSRIYTDAFVFSVLVFYRRVAPSIGEHKKIRITHLTHERIPPFLFLTLNIWIMLIISFVSLSSRFLLIISHLAQRVARVALIYSFRRNIREICASLTYKHIGGAPRGRYSGERLLLA